MHKKQVMRRLTPVGRGGHSSHTAGHWWGVPDSSSRATGAGRRRQQAKAATRHPTRPVNTLTQEPQLKTINAHRMDTINNIQIKTW